MKKHFITLVLCASLSHFPSFLQAQQAITPLPQALVNYFATYQNPDISPVNVKLLSMETDDKKTVILHLSESFAYQPLRSQQVETIYDEVKALLPNEYRRYKLRLMVNEYPIEDLVPNLYRKHKLDKTRLLGKVNDEEPQWVKNFSRPMDFSKGLEGRHIALWQSHGRYYKQEQGRWLWQRPRLFCTTEDLFTQSIVIPYLIPMLQNSGAVVFTPRERDIQKNEVIVDNDTRPAGSLYIEEKSRNGKFSTPMGISGFAARRTVYGDGQNPFEEGTIRMLTTEKKPHKAFVQWVPNLPEEGYYAVYVSYKTLWNSVNDAKYYVYHKGGVTEFKVNQRIGGGTWVYLGTFLFDKGNNDYGMVVLSNQSNEKGVVTADAVRFGGGMGNIARDGKVSGLPRYLEGARYYAQWAGMPISIYANKQGTSDYNEDINTRSLMTNYLSGGSAYNPDQEGRGVPFEVTMALHSDAGYKKNDGIVGSLAIHTSDYNNGRLAAGNGRLASRDLSDILLTQLMSDIRAGFTTSWQRRSIWDKNYSETRLPATASSILEFLSHQNFADMIYGHDPVFKFTVGRSIYKSLLRFTAQQHEIDYQVQPLPVQKFAIRFDNKKNSVKLTWSPTEDPSESTATPSEYILYTRIGTFGFDNGIKVGGTSYTVELEEGLTYSFCVTAANGGGESFPSEILSAYIAPRQKHKALIINGFTRLSGPAIVQRGDSAGFDLDEDPGVPYISNISYCGRQTGFDRSRAGIETEGGWGYSTSELEGKVLAGNTFDYPIVHGKAMQAAGAVSYVSCSRSALESGVISLDNYDMVDLILGLQKEDSVTYRLRRVNYKTFTPELQRLLSAYLRKGGTLLLSGSYPASDMNTTTTEALFTQTLLKYGYGGSARFVSSPTITGMQRTFTIPREIQGKNYPVVAPDCMVATEGAFPIFSYADATPAGIAYKGSYRIIALGFPFESIEQDKIRNDLMSGFVHFLLK